MSAPASFGVGDYAIMRIEEWSGALIKPADLMPDLDRDSWDALEPELVPRHYDPERGAHLNVVQSWVLRSADLTILVDTGIGNGKTRPGFPMWENLELPWLAELAALGVTPESVDYIVATHLHSDHVGWNTRWNDGEWVPTFPNARYLFPEPDVLFWDPQTGGEGSRHDGRAGDAPDFVSATARRNRLAFEDSVRPILEAGLADIWSGGFTLADGVTLEPAPGHTPGLSVLRVESGSDRAVLVGDMLHSPVQVAHPELNSCFCENAEEARASRARVLEWAADNTALVIPAHLAGSHAVEVKREGSRLRFHGI